MADLDTLSAKEAENGSRTEREIPADAIAIVPVRSLVLFPGMVIPVTLGRPRSIAAAQDAVRAEKQIGVLTQRDATVDEPGEIDLYRIGTVANVVRYLTGKDGSHHAVSQGEQRFRVVEFLHGWPFLVARIERIAPQEADSAQIQARFLNLKRQALEALELLPQVPQEMVQQINAISDPGALADIVAAYLDLTIEEKQEVLETIDLTARIDRVSRFLAERIEVLRLSQEIGQQTRASLDKRQREVLLREQMAAIQKELGESDGKQTEVAELGEAITKAEMPKEVEDQARRELRRLERMPEAAAEYGMIRTYLDWLIELPWKLPPEEPIDLKEARRILDEDHYGLDKIKRRIIEYLAVRKLAPEGKAPILCFVGPPGVGKTSLGQSIARAMGRKFVASRSAACVTRPRSAATGAPMSARCPATSSRASAAPGARNPVMMLDEIDKLGADIQGDPSAALLEVLDPEQNNTFRDHYLACRSICPGWSSSPPPTCSTRSPGRSATAWRSSASPATPTARSCEIAKRYLVKRQLEANGLKPEQAEISDAALREIIDHYTREAGVRNLEREIGRALRNAAVEIAEGRRETVKIDVTRPRRRPRPAALRERGGDADERARRRHRPRLDARRRRHPLRRGDPHPRQGSADPHRPARRRDEGERPGRAQPGQEPPRLARHRSSASGEERHPHPRARRRDPQGRAERRRRHDHGAGLAPHQPDDPERHRDDRRDQPPRAGAARSAGSRRRAPPRRAPG